VLELVRRIDHTRADSTVDTTTYYNEVSSAAGLMAARTGLIASQTASNDASAQIVFLLPPDLRLSGRTRLTSSLCSLDLVLHYSRHRFACGLEGNSFVAATEKLLSWGNKLNEFCQLSKSQNRGQN